jgi:hypothetical protein
MAKRFFKLKYITNGVATITAVPNQIATINQVFLDNVVMDPPNTEWESISALFDEFRVCAMKVKWIPSVNTALLFDKNAAYAPMFIYHDINSTEAISDITDTKQIIAYESSRTKNFFRPWSYYRKMQRNIPPAALTQAISLRGYVPTQNAANATTQRFCIYWNAVNKSQITSDWTLPADNILGTFIITRYVVARARR